MTVLIAGCGYVGSELARQLLTRGSREVFALRRNIRTLPDGVRPLAVDLANPGEITGLPHRIDTLFYTVGSDASTPEAYTNAYVTGLRNLCEALGRRGALPARLIVVSSTAVYAQDDGSIVDETSPTVPSRFSGQILLESEALARAFVDDTVAVRFGGIYGPGRTRFLDSVADGTASRDGKREYTNRIHRDDCAGVLDHLMTLASPRDVYIGVDDEPADRRTVVEWIAAELGIVAPDTPPTSPTALPQHGKRCSNRRLRESGYTFRYPTYRQGYAEMIDARRTFATKLPPA
jgi:nucleoside-diphosphate-sugar epimerase